MRWGQRIGVVAGNAMEFYDIAVYAAISMYLTVILEQQGVNHGQEIVWGIFALRFLIRPLGGIVIARYAEKHGRKSALILTSTLTGIATFLMAFMPVDTFGKYVVLFLLALQMVQAFSFGGEYPTIINYLLKDSQDNEKGRISAIIVGSSLVGVIVSTSIVLSLKAALSQEQMLSFGWRIPLIIGGLNILLSFWFRARLPYQTSDTLALKGSHSTFKTTLTIFMLTIPAAVVFYVQNMASTMIGNALLIGELKKFYPIINSGFLLLTVIAVGIIVDRISSPTKAFNYGAILLLLLGAPLYALMDSTSLVIVILSAVITSIIAAMILSNLASILRDKSKGQDTSLGLGYNLALSIFGGLTPIVISTLIPHGFVYAGLYVAIASVPVFLANKFHSSYTERAEQQQ